MTKILMCRPDFYGIEYEINPWMNINHVVDLTAAKSQWNQLYHLIQELGATTVLVEPVKGLPDMVFTANAGLFFQNKIFLSHFRYAERQGEVDFYRTFFIENNFTILEPPADLFFEGAGDALAAGDKLFAAFGFRTDRDYYHAMPALQSTELVYCELVDPYFYHLDTCFCPLTRKLALWYPSAFSRASQTEMPKHIELLAVPEDEAARFACNAVVIGEQVILPTHCPEISKTLNDRGFKTYACEMDEYLKAGGACKCLTLCLS